MFPTLVALFALSFVSATLLPMASEGFLLALAHNEENQIWWLWGAATAGNVSGALFNWWLGRQTIRLRTSRWFPFTERNITTGRNLFMKYGLPSLLFAWLPIIGDPLTFVAGTLKVPMWLFLGLVTVGKGARYAALLWFV